MRALDGTRSGALSATRARCCHDAVDIGFRVFVLAALMHARKQRGTVCKDVSVSTERHET